MRRDYFEVVRTILLVVWIHSAGSNLCMLQTDSDNSMGIVLTKTSCKYLLYLFHLSWTTSWCSRNSDLLFITIATTSYQGFFFWYKTAKLVGFCFSRNLLGEGNEMRAQLSYTLDLFNNNKQRDLH